MRNREDRVRRELPGAPEALVRELAGYPAYQVGFILAAVRQGKADALSADRAKRRQRKAEARKYRWYSPAELAGRDRRLLDSAGLRAAGDLEALAALAAFARQVDALTHEAVARLRERYSDTEIGEALGITRQAVGQRFGIRGSA